MAYKPDYDQRRAIITANASLRTVEQPLGLIDGTNKVYRTAQVFYPNSLKVYVDGVRKFEKIDYSVTGEQQITFLTALTVGKVLVLEYITPDQMPE